MNTRVYYIPEGGSPSTLQLTTCGWLSLRSFIVAFEAEGDHYFSHVAQWHESIPEDD